MAASKTFTVGFYQQIVTKNQVNFVSTLLKKIMVASQQAGFKHSTFYQGDYAYQVRDVQSRNDGKTFSAVFVKFRTANLPELGQLDGDLEAIDLGNNDGVVDKNYFLYSRDRELLVYQSNREGASHNKLGEFFTDMVNNSETIQFAPVLSKDSAKRLMNASAEVKKIEFSIARPHIKNITANDTLSRFAKDLCNNTNGYNVHVTLSRQPRSAGEWLSSTVKSGLSVLCGAGASVAKAWVDDNENPIDLIADRIKGSITVPMTGHYPDAQKVIGSMRKLRKTKEKELKQVTSLVSHESEDES